MQCVDISNRDKMEVSLLRPPLVGVILVLNLFPFELRKGRNLKYHYSMSYPSGGFICSIVTSIRRMIFVHWQATFDMVNEYSDWISQ